MLSLMNEVDPCFLLSLYVLYEMQNQIFQHTSGYMFTLAGGAVSWKSFKQVNIARSTTEAELVTLEKVGSEAK